MTTEPIFASFPAYKYHYLRPDEGYFFRYDKPLTPGDEPPTHLHVIREGPPRYPTHAAHLDEMLQLIEVSFFA